MKLLCVLAVVAACINAQQQIQPASVEGVVSNALTGEPLRYVHVSLRAAEAKYGAITTAEGHFSIASITPGAYALTAERNGYLPPQTVPLSLKPDDHKRDLALKMMPAAVISGRVVDENGDPLEGVTVRTIRGEPAGADRTNDNGEFRVAALCPGKYLLRAARDIDGTQPEIRSDGTTEVYYGPTYYPGVVSASMAVAVEAKAGVESSEVEIRLVRQPIVRVSGKVTGAVPYDLRNAYVLADYVDPAPKDRWGDWVTDYSGRVRLRPDGGFTFWRVPPGPQRLTAQFVGKANQGLRSAPLDIVAADSNIENLDLAIVAPFELTGSIDGWSAAAGKLHLMPLGRPAPEEIVAGIAAAGAFHLERVQPDQYRVTIPDLPDNLYIKRLRLGALDMPEGILDVRRGASGDPLTIEISTAAARISGTVSDSNGPVSGALVALFPEGHHPDQLRILIRSGSDGAYSIRGLAPGKYAILTLPPQEPEAVARYHQNAEIIELNEGDAILKDLKLPSGR
jgi:protocatechuate 3,4-dioxygenase beta subunit